MKKDIKSALLTKEQTDVVKNMIVASMRSGFTNTNQMVPDNFMEVTRKIADAIIHNVQMALGQATVFDKILVKDAKKKAKKEVKKIVKKVTSKRK